MRSAALQVAAILGALGVGSCQSAERRTETALIAVVDEMQKLLPPEVQADAPRQLGATFEGLDGGLVPEAVREAAGYRAVYRDVAPEPGAVILNLFRPRLVGDTVRVRAEWLVFDSSGSFWGEGRTFTFECGKTCTLLDQSGPDYLN